MTGRRLLTPFSEASPECEEALNVEIATKANKGWQTQFLEFLEHGWLPVNLAKRVEIIWRATKFLILKDILCDDHLKTYPLTHHKP